MARKYLTDEELSNILEDDSEAELEFSEDESDNEDNIEVHEKFSDEISEESNENSDDDAYNEGGDEVIFKTKSGLEWQSRRPAVSRRRAHNFVNSKEGLQNASLSITCISEAFKLFITEDMVSEICICTNRQGELNQAKWNNSHPDNQKKWKPVAVDEFYSFIAVLIASGRNRGRKMLWKKCGLKMSYLDNRFSLLLCLETDSKSYLEIADLTIRPQEKNV